jgi:MFS transporter, SHS family, lactate transporter
VFTNIATFVSAFFWGALADKIGRRWAMIIPAGIGLLITPLYLATVDYTLIAVAFAIQGAFAGSMYSQIPAYMTERFPTEVRATASAFCYHVGAIFGGLVAPVLTWFAVDRHLGFAVPMMVCACVAIICYIGSLLAWPETKGQEMVPDLELLPAGPGGTA